MYFVVMPRSIFEDKQVMSRPSWRVIMTRGTSDSLMVDFSHLIEFSAHAGWLICKGQDF